METNLSPDQYKSLWRHFYNTRTQDGMRFLRWSKWRKMSIVHLCEGGISRPREIFWGFSALWFLKNLSTFLSALAISGHSERFSPGPNGSEVGGPIYINNPSGPPTSEPFTPGENLSEWPEIARALRNWPKFFKNHKAENPQKISRGLSIGPMSMTQSAVRSQDCGP